ncbi:hypothetical protein DSECCO2_380740 [anaerobic digester metagenome]
MVPEGPVTTSVPLVTVPVVGGLTGLVVTGGVTTGLVVVGGTTTAPPVGSSVVTS